MHGDNFSGGHGTTLTTTLDGYYDFNVSDTFTSDYANLTATWMVKLVDPQTQHYRNVVRVSGSVEHAREHQSQRLLHVRGEVFAAGQQQCDDGAELHGR